MGTASLQSLSNELFEQVVQRLDLHDIRNVRLANRSTALRAAQNTYRSFFRHKHVDLRRGTLQSFVNATSQNGVGCLVEHLSLIVIVYDPNNLQLSIESGRPRRRPGSSRKVERAYTTQELGAIRQDLALLERRREEDEAFREAGADVILLCEALSNIAASKKGPLKTLSLCIKVHRGDTVKPTARPPPSPWRSKQTFKAAMNTHCLAMESLRSSQLKVQALDIFFKRPEQLECSVPCDVLSNTDLTRLGSCLSTLEVFSVSITDPMVDETKYPDCSLEGEEHDASVARNSPTFLALSTHGRISRERNYAAISSMLQLCPRLQELRVVAYPLDCSEHAEIARLQNLKRKRHMYHLARAPPLSQLRKFAVAGLNMHDADLLSFLQTHVSSLREVELVDIGITESSFRSIVEYITGRETARLTKIRLENIREGNNLIHYHCDWEEEGVGSVCDRDVVRKWGDQGRKHIDYFGEEFGVLGCAVIWEWTLEKRVREEEEDE